MRRMVRLLAIAILLFGTDRVFANNSVVEPPCEKCGDESTLSDEITITATVSEPFSVVPNDPTLSFHPVVGSGHVAGTLLRISGPAYVNPALRDDATASFTIGGAEGEQVLVDIIGAPEIERRRDDVESGSIGDDRIGIDLAWSGDQVPVVGRPVDGTFPALVTLGDDNGTRPDGRGAFRMWVGGSTRGVPVASARYQGKVKIKMYFLE